MKLSDVRRLSQRLAEVYSENELSEAELRRHLREIGLDPDNIYQELEMESRFVDTHKDVSYTNTPIQLHSHNFYELIYCREGGGTEYLLGSERYRLQRGDIIIIPPGMSHRPLPPPDATGPYKRYVLWISREFMNQFFLLFPSRDSAWSASAGLVRTAGTQWAELRELFRRGVAEAEQRAYGWEAAVAGNTMLLLAQLERAVFDRASTKMAAEEPELLDSVIAYIEAHLEQPLRLAQVAEQFYVSESTISHTFREKMGISFYRLVTQRRLIAAKSLILKGEHLDSVSRRVGFGDYSSFYRAFRQEYGISPRQYRAMQKDEGI